VRDARREGRRGSDPRRTFAAAFALCCLPFASLAQVSGSVGALSDYRYRGYSLSDGDPALQASIAYDAANGAYAGLFGSNVRDEAGSGAQWLPYFGYAKRDAKGRSWDVGLRWSHDTRDDEFDYAEVHVGVALRRVALRLHYAPDYFGQVANWYAEADGHVPLGERVRATWHVGYARSDARDRYVYIRDPTPYDDDGGYYVFERADPTRIDLRLGVAIPTRACDVQLAWTHVDGGETYTYEVPWDANDRTGWVLGCVKRW
jgi:uncharacterized protein (TIGR02001 family)